MNTDVVTLSSLFEPHFLLVFFLSCFGITASHRYSQTTPVADSWSNTLDRLCSNRPNLFESWIKVKEWLWLPMMIRHTFVQKLLYDFPILMHSKEKIKSSGIFLEFLCTRPPWQTGLLWAQCCSDLYRFINVSETSSSRTADGKNILIEISKY